MSVLSRRPPFISLALTTVVGNMAGTNISVDKEQFCCSVCLDVLWEPVTIPCGHSYCMECIKGYWRKCDLKEEYSCPQCRRTFSPRPALFRNTMLADIVEKLRRTGVQDGHAKPAEAECDVCTGKKRRAVAFCVKCQTSYCETHLKAHNERNRGRTHQLAEVTSRPQKRICSRHNKLKEVYCRTDHQCVCSSCLKDGHKGHDVVSVMEERIEKQVPNTDLLFCINTFRYSTNLTWFSNRNSWRTPGRSQSKDVKIEKKSSGTLWNTSR